MSKRCRFFVCNNSQRHIGIFNLTGFYLSLLISYGFRFDSSVDIIPTFRTQLSAETIICFSHSSNSLKSSMHGVLSKCNVVGLRKH